MHANRLSVCFPLEMHTLLIDRNRGFRLRFYLLVMWYLQLPIMITFIGLVDLVRPYFFVFLGHLLSLIVDFDFIY